MIAPSMMENCVRIIVLVYPNDGCDLRASTYDSTVPAMSRMTFSAYSRSMLFMDQPSWLLLMAWSIAGPCTGRSGPQAQARWIGVRSSLTGLRNGSRASSPLKNTLSVSPCLSHSGQAHPSKSSTTQTGLRPQARAILVGLPEVAPTQGLLGSPCWTRVQSTAVYGRTM